MQLFSTPAKLKPCVQLFKTNFLICFRKTFLIYTPHTHTHTHTHTHITHTHTHEIKDTENHVALQQQETHLQNEGNGKRGRKMTQLSVEITDQTLLNEARNDSVFPHASDKLSVGGFDQ
jgi:hypothetical protein